MMDIFCPHKLVWIGPATPVRHASEVGRAQFFIDRTKRSVIRTSLSPNIGTCQLGLTTEQRKRVEGQLIQVLNGAGIQLEPIKSQAEMIDIEKEIKTQFITIL